MPGWQSQPIEGQQSAFGAAVTVAEELAVAVAVVVAAAAVAVVVVAAAAATPEPFAAAGVGSEGPGAAKGWHLKQADWPEEYFEEA